MDDDVVAPELGMAARDFLLEQAYSVEWHEYPMPHSVCLPEVKAIGKWLKARMAVG
jgi:phospholipase/carboxylesterase